MDQMLRTQYTSSTYVLHQNWRGAASVCTSTYQNPLGISPYRRDLYVAG